MLCVYSACLVRVGKLFYYNQPYVHVLNELNDPRIYRCIDAYFIDIYTNIILF